MTLMIALFFVCLWENIINCSEKKVEANRKLIEFCFCYLTTSRRSEKYHQNGLFCKFKKTVCLLYVFFCILFRNYSYSIFRITWEFEYVYGELVNHYYFYVLLALFWNQIIVLFNLKYHFCMWRFSFSLKYVLIWINQFSRCVNGWQHMVLGICQ